ncbi:MAG: (Fe-S)-binding protein [Alphaproteobacteria bacterium]|nr:(Fe-S)-binding protein [Alphaproteobacteria bacterium]
MKKIPYVTVFERTRILGTVLAPDDLEFKTDLAHGETTEPLVLHISCQVINVPHIPYLAQKIMRRMGLEFTTLGGPENCCGAYHWHFGDHDLEKQIATISLNAYQRSQAKTVLSLCPSCDDRYESNRGKQHTFRHANVTEIFVQHLDKLKPLLRSVKTKVVLHRHGTDAGRRQDAEHIETLMRAVPGVELLPAQHAYGSPPHCQTVSPMPPDETAAMFEEAKALGAQYVVVPYHSCYRQHCKMQLKYGVEVQHFLGIVAQSMGIPFEERFKELRLLDSVDRAMERLRPRIQKLGLREEQVRPYVQQVVYL